MLENDQINEVAGQEVYGADGERIGKADTVYVDDETGRPKWVSVHTGLLGSNLSFIPLEDSDYTNGRLSVPYDKGRVKGAPDVSGGGHLSHEDEDVLFRYYRGEGGTSDGRGFADTSRTAGTTDTDVATGTAATTDLDRGTDGTDDAMTVSEEQLAVSTRSIPGERVRLRKYVVTEEVTLTVTIRKERFSIEREPFGEDEVSGYTGTTDFEDFHSEIVLHEEVPVVEKVVRPVERIRLDKEVVTESQNVTGTVRKERVDVQTDVDGDAGTEGDAGVTDTREHDRNPLT